jgi:hypothetical protein
VTPGSSPHHPPTRVDATLPSGRRNPAVPGPAIVYDPRQCRAWLAGGVADEEEIDDSFCTEEVSIPAGLEGLLAELDNDPQPQVWQLRHPLQQGSVWRTCDGDGIDGGAIITTDLRVGGERVRLATLHQGFDDFVDDADTVGIDAAVEALGRVADLINHEVAVYDAVTAAPQPDPAAAAVYTVLGVWNEDEPVPVGVVAGDHQVTGGSGRHFEQGLWATSVTAADADTAEQAAVADMRATARHQPR